MRAARQLIAEARTGGIGGRMDRKLGGGTGPKAMALGCLRTVIQGLARGDSLEIRRDVMMQMLNEAVAAIEQLEERAPVAPGG